MLTRNEYESILNGIERFIKSSSKKFSFKAMMGQNRSGMRISSVSSAGYVSAGGRLTGINRGFGCPEERFVKF